MKCIPHEYQKEACDRIIRQKKIGLFLDMGLGKTLITLTAVKFLIKTGLIRKVLIIAPLRVAQVTWTEEAEKWEHLQGLTFSKVLGTAKQREKALETEADCYIINRENVPWLCELFSQPPNPPLRRKGGLDGKEPLQPKGGFRPPTASGPPSLPDGKEGQRVWDFDMLVIDELSSFKSHSSERFKKLKKYAPLCDRVVGLTGTPTSNGLINLWSQIFLLDQGERLQKRFTWFRDLYFEPDKYFGQNIRTYKPRWDAEERITEKLSDLCFSMQAKDYLELPERSDIIHYVDFTPKLAKKYKEFKDNAFMEFENGEATALSGATLINKLLQFCNGAVYLDENSQFPLNCKDGQIGLSAELKNHPPSATVPPPDFRRVKWEEIHRLKLEALGEILEFANSPVLCFYSYKHDLDRIKREFPEAVKLETPEDMAKWNKGEIPLALCHPASAGHGLNLQAGGHIIVWFGLPWSLELYQQANARLHRQGQSQRVQIYHIMARGTADEKVYYALKSKNIIQEKLLEDLK